MPNVIDTFWWPPMLFLLHCHQFVSAVRHFQRFWNWGLYSREKSIVTLVIFHTKSELRFFSSIYFILSWPGLRIGGDSLLRPYCWRLIENWWPQKNLIESAKTEWGIERGHGLTMECDRVQIELLGRREKKKRCFGINFAERFEPY